MNDRPRDKAGWRRWGAEQRRTLDASQRDAASAAVTARVLALPAVREAVSICCYVSMGAEVETRPLLTPLLDRGVEVSVPVLQGEQMTAAKLTSLAELRPASFGVEQPEHLTPVEHPPSIILTPGVVFGHGGERIGRGAGHYDRFFTHHTDALAIALLFDEQLVQPGVALPVEPHDRAMDLLVTPTRVIEVRPRGSGRPGSNSPA